MMVPAALTVTVAGTSAAAPAARRLKEAVVTVAGLMARLNVALTVVFRGIPIEFGVGVCSVTVGRVAMVNVKRSEEHTSELQSRLHLVCRLLLEKKKKHRMRISLP